MKQNNIRKYGRNNGFMLKRQRQIHNEKRKNVKYNDIHLLEDLRKSLIIATISYVCFFIVCFVNKQLVYDFITKPIKTLLNDNKIIMIYTNIFESFTADISVCGYTAFFVSIPFFLFAMYKFFAPSLYEKEKKIAILLACFGMIMVCVSFLLLYYFIFPQAINFFVSPDIQQGNQIVKPFFKISEYISTFFHMLIGFSIAFQTPLILFGLVKLGLIGQQALTKHRKIAIIIIFIISAIITPPDVFSQVICATLLIIIYEITNFLIKLSK